MPPSSAPSQPAGQTRLTGRGLALLGLSLGAVVLGAVLPEPAAVQLGLLGLLLVAGAWPLAARNLSGLRVTRTCPDTAFAGQLFPYTLTLENEAQRPARGVELEDSIAGPAERGMDALLVPAGGKSSRSFFKSSSRVMSVASFESRFVTCLAIDSLAAAACLSSTAICVLNTSACSINSSELIPLAIVYASQARIWLSFSMIIS